MSPVPAQPKIYHITHVDNLAAIVAERHPHFRCYDAYSWWPSCSHWDVSDKKRRVEEIGVSCHHGTMVGDYVPFYFCPRSVMLYLLYQANHPDLTYREGQPPIVHLEADVHEVVAWANGQSRRWAFSLSNAGARYVQFRDSLDQLDEVNWAAVEATNFRSSDIKEGKQAEFLVHGSFSWKLVRRIGVYSAVMKARAETSLAQTRHRPPVEILRDWYY